MGLFKTHQKFDGIYVMQGKKAFLTSNLDKGKKIYGERIFDFGNMELRLWNPYRSKLCAAMHNNARRTLIKSNSTVLYLGASSGTTVSHLSDILKDGLIYAVEFSPRTLRELVQNCVDRHNVIPILGDVNRPFEYSKLISGPVDILYMDVAQPNQSELLLKNAEWFLNSKGGQFLYAIKARSIDSVGRPQDIFDKEIEFLEAAGFVITDQIALDPFTEDHLMLFGRYNPDFY
jgi:fibrillarin-like rRNA methylase